MSYGYGGQIILSDGRELIVGWGGHTVRLEGPVLRGMHARYEHPETYELPSRDGYRCYAPPLHRGVVFDITVWAPNVHYGEAIGPIEDPLRGRLSLEQLLAEVHRRIDVRAGQGE